MILRELYEKAIEIGLKHDPRSQGEIADLLDKYKKTYEGLSEKEKDFFDKELMKHPFADTRILNGPVDREIMTLFVGIDIDAGEILAVDRLREKGIGIDAVVSHHPSARAWAQFYEVMDMQTNILEALGLNPVVAEKLLAERKSQVKRKVMPANHFRGLDIAKLFDVPWLCIHTPADNCVYDFLNNFFAERKPRRLGQVIDLLYEIPEYQEGAKRGVGPVILLGSKDSRVGKIALEMTGGTEPSVENYMQLAQKGIGTIVGMHFSEEHYKKAKEAKLNLVVAGHMPSDTLGLNLLLDEIEDAFGEIKVINASGFYRIRH